MAGIGDRECSAVTPEEGKSDLAEADEVSLGRQSLPGVGSRASGRSRRPRKES
jgi:hypothetical protein